MSYRIEPLSYETLAEAQTLVFSIFKHDRARRALAATLDPSIANQYEDMRGFSDRASWVARNEAGPVTGVVGLYACDEDKIEADWVNWYCVDPAARGHGLGRRLLEQAIEGARARGKKVLRLWTTDDPTEAEAQLVYEKMGFPIYKTEPSEGAYEGDTIIYRQKSL